MTAAAPLLRPLGIAAAAIASLEALVWGIMSLLGLLTIQEVIVPENPTEQYEVVTLALVGYLIGKKDTTLPFLGVFIASNAVWLIVSGLMFHCLVKRTYKQIILVIWAVVTYLVCIIDGAGTIVFGLAFDDEKNNFNNIGINAKFTDLARTNAPLILMVLSARGFVLWLLNLGAAIFITQSVRNLKNNSDTNKDSPRRLSDTDIGSASYYYNSVKGDKDSYSRNNPAFQPEPLSAWNIQSPVVGASRRGPWTFPETSSPKLENRPIRIFPRVGRPVSSPIAPITPVLPLPTPQPDYSPPLGRPVKHEPNLYDSPVRSVLKKPTQMGRTIL